MFHHRLSRIFAGILALSLNVGVVSADFSSDGGGSDPKPSGRYLDLTTLVIYQYNNITHTLTPTLERGSPLDFICVDAFASGTISPCGEMSSAENPCPGRTFCTLTCEGYLACAATSVALVGSHDLRALTTIYPSCGEPESQPPASGTRGIVTYLRKTTARVVSSICPGELVIDVFNGQVAIGHDDVEYS